MNIQFSLDSKEVEQKLTKISAGLKNYKKPLNLAGDDIVDYTQNKVFKSQGAQLGEPWRQLSASTLKARRQRTGYYRQTPIVTGKILIWTGNLLNSFQRTAKRYELRVTNTTDYYKYHQKGQRKMLAINRDTIRMVTNRINERIKQLLK